MEFEDIEKLRKELKCQVFTDRDTLEEVSFDFGRLVHRTPKAVVVPGSIQDVQKLLELANEYRWPIAVRGSSLSQFGQSLSHDGILLDMSALARVERIDGDSAWVLGGTTWADLVKSALERGLLPTALPANLEATVGGVLSASSLGTGSHLGATALDSVHELQVVTGEGHLLRCSAQDNQVLFDCVRGGLGQFAVIVRARIKLRACRSRVRALYLLYDDLRTLMGDQLRIMKAGRVEFLESACTPCQQGLRSVGGSQVPFAEWFYTLHLGLEFDDTPPDSHSLLRGLRHYRHTHTEDLQIGEFLSKCGWLIRIWKETGSWNLPHPFLEGILPWERSAPFLEGILRSLPVHLVSSAQIALWPLRSLTQAPLFQLPAGEYLMGFGIMPAVPRPLLPVTLSMLGKASDLCMETGGRRLLSGWVDFDLKRWQQHFGEAWKTVLASKRFFDPNGVLNPQVVDFAEPGILFNRSTRSRD